MIEASKRSKSRISPPTKRHLDDQRDVTAFVFSANGFSEEAQWARNSERRLQYWAEADRLTDKVLEAGAAETGSIARLSAFRSFSAML